MVRANAHIQACLGAAGARESSSSFARCLLGDQCLVSSGPSACSTASVSSKSYNKLLSVPAGNGWKNPSVVGKQEAGYGIQPCRELLGGQEFMGCWWARRGAQSYSGVQTHARCEWSCSLCPHQWLERMEWVVSCAPQSSTNNQAALKASTHRDISPAKAHSVSTHLLLLGQSGVAIFIFKGLLETGRAQ